jgi:hypothetical protein
VHFTDFVVDPGVEQDALRRSGLTGINVRHDADISIPFEWNFPSHR